MTVQRPYLLLVSALVLLFFLVPFTGGAGEGGNLLNLLFSAVLVAGIAFARGRPSDLRIGLALGVPTIALRWAAFSSDALAAASGCATLAFLGFTTWLVLVSIMRQRRVTLDTVLGGVSAYLLIGLIWAVAFGLVETLGPGAFSVPGSARAELNDLLYLSFVTLTTLGYGDFAPVSPFARTLAATEALVGQIFLAVFIARLVALYSVRDGDA